MLVECMLKQLLEEILNELAIHVKSSHEIVITGMTCSWKQTHSRHFFSMIYLQRVNISLEGLDLVRYFHCLPCDAAALCIDSVIVYTDHIASA